MTEFDNSSDLEQETTSSEGLETEEIGDETSSLSSSQEEQEAAESNKLEQQEAKAKSRLQKLIDSKGGDEDKLVDSIYAGWNSASKMQQQLDELRELIQSSSKQAQETEAEPLDNNEEYQWLKNEKESLEEDLAQNESLRQGLVKEYSQLQLEREVLTRTNGSPADIKAIDRDLRDIKNRYDQTLREDKRTNSNKTIAELRLKNAEKHLNSLREKTKLEEKQNKAEITNFRAEFDNAVIPEIKKAGLTPKQEQRIYKAVMAEAREYIETNGMVSSMSQLGLEILSDWLQEAQSKKFAETSAEKQQASRKPVAAAPQAKTAKTQVQRPAPGNGKLTADEAKALTERWARS